MSPARVPEEPARTLQCTGRRTNRDTLARATRSFSHVLSPEPHNLRGAARALWPSVLGGETRLTADFPTWTGTQGSQLTHLLGSSHLPPPLLGEVGGHPLHLLQQVVPVRPGPGGLLQLGQPPQGPQAFLPQLGDPLMDMVFLWGRGGTSSLTAFPQV